MTTLSPAQERARIAFDLIANIRGLTNVEIGRRTGLGTSKVQSRRTGSPKNGIAAITLTDLPALADALDVPVELLQKEPVEIFRWFADQWAARDSNPEPADLGRSPIRRSIFQQRRAVRESRKVRRGNAA